MTKKELKRTVIELAGELADVRKSNRFLRESYDKAIQKIAVNDKEITNEA